MRDSLITPNAQARPTVCSRGAVTSRLHEIIRNILLISYEDMNNLKSMIDRDI